IGVAVPYLNAASIPFEKRYFGGGANGIRGWQARTLGPGTFKGTGNSMVYDLQAGDIRLDVNLEYRYKVVKFLELAAFLDAGNIWTIREYEDQPGGAFQWDQFYKQIAWSYGVGVRFDLSILIFRIDFGVKLHDPSRIAEGKQWRTAPNGLNWKEDMTFHFAIGHPF
ncbi:MAG: BamA/TamA family outer membrane protein, partial [Paludibacteraceae bacterium]|nr:BamA/TamA family outer membrane protein [Paludibacteraceae bacterium]